LIRVLAIEQTSDKCVELRGFEPLTFCMPCSRVSSDDVVLGPVAAVQSGSNVWGRLARSGGIWGRWYLVWSWFCRTAVNEGSAVAARFTGDAMTLVVTTGRCAQSPRVYRFRCSYRAGRAHARRLIAQAFRLSFWVMPLDALAQVEPTTLIAIADNLT
jgi:hypothetical protein